MRRHIRFRALCATAVVTAVVPLAAACDSLPSSNKETSEVSAPASPEAPSDAPASTTSEDPEGATDTEASAAESESATESESASAGASESEKSSVTGKKLSPGVKDAYAQFKSLAPEKLFAQFESCDSIGIKNSYNCSGSEVGQFQFFESSAKASQTTQLLTELRSSHVVEDTGSRVVGWSTLGSTAVVTVVDNDKGQVMQHMISTDQEDPEDKIESLGLAQPSDSEPKRD